MSLEWAIAISIGVLYTVAFALARRSVYKSFDETAGEENAKQN